MLRGYDFDEYTGRWVLFLDGKRVFVNHNVTSLQFSFEILASEDMPRKPSRALSVPSILL